MCLLLAVRAPISVNQKFVNAVKSACLPQQLVVSVGDIRLLVLQMSSFAKLKST